MSEQVDEAQTQIFLKTNGPPAEVFHPSVPDFVLDGASKRERYLLEQSSIQSKQNAWLIKETTGMKRAHRVIHARLAQGDKRFDRLDEENQWLREWRTRWFGGEKMLRTAIAAILTLLLLPLLANLATEIVKHFMHWN